MKHEILKAISNLEIDDLDFDRELFSNSATNDYEFESENYLIKLSLTEEIIWHNEDWGYECERQKMYVNYLNIFDENLNEIKVHITDKEILNNLKWQ